MLAATAYSPLYTRPGGRWAISQREMGSQPSLGKKSFAKLLSLHLLTRKVIDASLQLKHRQSKKYTDSLCLLSAVSVCWLLQCGKKKCRCCSYCSLHFWLISQLIFLLFLVCAPQRAVKDGNFNLPDRCPQ